ncbi:Hypothetical protein LUCI_1367 [Lucifera butyrica]|uniref:Pentapeptide repeat-containing protein n=1 Tax=Lucifera butyrica TaxID=1351585 RepID=A0A498R7A8_9FIRM|nr:pentapeptide repeat-containing protein [Lucifera butyrica]VBB06152.1 Hypothetical protein LUCI_1367 [Lucifera butyrica]
MNQYEALLHLLKNGAAEPYYQNLEALDAYYLSHLEKLTEDFVLVFCRFCRKVRKQQEQGRKGKIAYIHCSFLYTSLMEGKGGYRLDALDENWYLDKQECAGSYDGAWAYSFLHEFCCRLNDARKKYAGRITVYDIDLIKRTEAARYGAYVEAIARRGMKKAVTCPEFIAMEKEDVVHITIGEYKDQSREIYRYDIRPKDWEAVQTSLAQQERRFTGEVWTALDFPAMNMDQLELQYVRFAKSTFQQTQLRYSELWGADFTGARISKSDFFHSVMPGADFSQAEITGSRFHYIDGAQCNLTRERFIGILPGISFAQATLRNVNFYHAQLNQANFRETRFIDCDFMDCCLTGADFSRAEFTHCHFTRAQMGAAVFSPDTNLECLGLDPRQRQEVIRRGV